MEKLLKMGWIVEQMQFQQGDLSGWWYFSARHCSGEASAEANGENYHETFLQFMNQMKSNTPKWYLQTVKR